MHPKVATRGPTLALQEGIGLRYFEILQKLPMNDRGPIVAVKGATWSDSQDVVPEWTAWQTLQGTSDTRTDRNSLS